MDKLPNLPFYLKATVILIGVAVFLYVLYLTENILAPLVFALFIAILLNPLVNLLTRWKLNRVIAIFLSVFLVVVLAIGLVAFVSMQVSMFSETSSQFEQKFNSVAKDVIQWVSVTFHVNTLSIQHWMKDSENNVVKNIFGSLLPAIVSVGSAIIIVVIIPVYIFLILYYRSLLLEFIGKMFDPKNHKVVVEVLETINSIIRKYLTGLLIEGAIVATLNSIALLVLGVEYAILLGISGAVLNVIPYLGGVVAVAMPMLVAFVTKSPLTALLVMVVYMVIQFIDNHYLVPYIVASKVKINALIAIIVVLIGNMVWGIPGMFLSIPVTALIKVICDHIEPLKPFGFLLGDTIPDSQKLLLFRKRRN